MGALQIQAMEVKHCFLKGNLWETIEAKRPRGGSGLYGERGEAHRVQWTAIGKINQKEEEKGCDRKRGNEGARGKQTSIRTAGN